MTVDADGVADAVAVDACASDVGTVHWDGD